MKEHPPPLVSIYIANFTLSTNYRACQLLLNKSLITLANLHHTRHDQDVPCSPTVYTSL